LRASSDVEFVIDRTFDLDAGQAIAETLAILQFHPGETGHR